MWATLNVWALCSVDGHLFRLRLYGGAIERTAEPLGHRIVNQLLQVCDRPEEHTVTFNNFFSSHDLMLELIDARISGYWNYTIQSN